MFVNLISLPIYLLLFICRYLNKSLFYLNNDSKFNLSIHSGGVDFVIIVNIYKNIEQFNRIEVFIVEKFIHFYSIIVDQGYFRVDFQKFWHSNQIGILTRSHGFKILASNQQVGTSPTHVYNRSNSK